MGPAPHVAFYDFIKLWDMFSYSNHCKLKMPHTLSTINIFRRSFGTKCIYIFKVYQKRKIEFYKVQFRKTQSEKLTSSKLIQSDSRTRGDPESSFSWDGGKAVNFIVRTCSKEFQTRFPESKLGLAKTNFLSKTHIHEIELKRIMTCPRDSTMEPGLPNKDEIKIWSKECSITTHEYKMH